MKSFKKYLKEDDVSALEPEPYIPDWDDPDYDWDYHDRQCDSWRQLVDMYKTRINEYEALAEACWEQFITDCLVNDGITDCAEQCLNDMCPDGIGGKGGLWDPDCFDPVVFIECIDSCYQQHVLDCEKMNRRCNQNQEILDGYRQRLQWYERKLAERCGKEEVFARSTRKPDLSAKLTPIEPTIGPNTK